MKSVSEACIRAHEMDPASFRSNLFQVKFDVLPGASKTTLDLLPYLICSANIPSENCHLWFITAYVTNLEIFNTFTNWLTHRMDDLGEATIELFSHSTESTEPNHKYKLSGLRINSVDDLELAWDEASEPAKFSMYFSFQSIENTPCWYQPTEPSVL